MNRTEMYFLIASDLIKIGINPKKLELEIEGNVVRAKHTKGMKQYQVMLTVSEDNQRSVGEQDIDRFVAERIARSFGDIYYPNKHKWMCDLFKRTENGLS